MVAGGEQNRQKGPQSGFKETGRRGGHGRTWPENHGVHFVCPQPAVHVVRQAGLRHEAAAVAVEGEVGTKAVCRAAVAKAAAAAASASARIV